MPTPQLNARSDSVRGTPCSSISRTAAGSAQVPRSSTAAEPVGDDPRRVAGQPAAGDVREGVHRSTPSSATSARQSRA